ncbi:ABC transporter ATP-binding protein [Pseudoclavibacter terrae]|uniref:ABC transporter ATP-binding protein n=1 Tax=Pseudoclavibacter terrae TaxID=1530195 RepID=UPI00232DC141|nr:ATP-binding cassette domain-containing protein [Pseudoclavibacter terrae]
MLEIQNISKTYGDRKVLDDVSFSVEPGKLTGFVGGNGAGKTTTMRTILGVVKPDAGVVTIDGRPVVVTDRARFGYMPEERGLYPKMKVKEQVTYFAELHGLSAKEAAKHADRFLEDLGLTERAGDNVEDLSLGNQQRAQIAASLAHEPEMLILDEPFSGLDPLAVEVVLETLQGFAARGVPVLFSSHQLDVVERLSDNLVIISGGAIRASGDRHELQERHSEGMHRISVAGDAGWLRDEPGITVLEFDRGDAIFVADSGETAQRILRTALDRGPVFGFGRHIVKLSDIYREVVA